MQPVLSGSLVEPQPKAAGACLIRHVLAGTKVTRVAIKVTKHGSKALQKHLL